MIFKKFIDNLDESDIDVLISMGIEEDIHLDYKLELPAKQNDKGKKELAKDVSAFANSDGGYIIYGVEEKDHKPVNKVGIDSIGTKEKIENICLHYVQPHADLRIKPVDLQGTDDQLFVVWIPKSSIAPHMTDFRFYKRQNFSSVPMEEYEVKELYRRNFEYKSQIELYLLKKNFGLNNPNNDESLWISFLSCPHFITDNIMPVNEDMKKFLDPNKYHLTKGDFLFSEFPQYTLTGFSSEHSGNRGGKKAIIQRTVWERTGFIQLGKYYGYIEEKLIPIMVVIEILESFLKFIISFYEKIEYSANVKLILSMQNVQGWAIPINQMDATSTYGEKDLQIFRDINLLDLRENYNLLLKDMCNQLFQGFGEQDCPFIDNIGNIDFNRH